MDFPVYGELSYQLDSSKVITEKREGCKGFGMGGDERELRLCVQNFHIIDLLLPYEVEPGEKVVRNMGEGGGYGGAKCN